MVVVGRIQRRVTLNSLLLPSFTLIVLFMEKIGLLHWLIIYFVSREAEDFAEIEAELVDLFFHFHNLLILLWIIMKLLYDVD